MKKNFNLKLAVPYDNNGFELSNSLKENTENFINWLDNVT